jgi:glycosyltransferase involved in cell wall biosynthesis
MTVTHPENVSEAAATTPAIASPSAADTIGVLHVINGEHYAGAERVQDLLALRLPEWGFEVGFACVKPGSFTEMRESRNAPVYHVPMRARLDLRAAWKIARIVRREGYRLLHAHTVRTAIVGRLAAALAGVPLVYHVHSPTSRNTTRRWWNRVNSVVERLSLTGAKRLITVSESLGRHMEQQGFSRTKITVVPNGVPKVEAIPSRPAPTGQWTLGTVALFRPRKGVEVLLEALAILKQQGLPVRLRAVGAFETPQYALAIAARTARLGVADLVEWPGFTRDVTAELLQMDLFVLPSLFGEGLPMVVLEAMAAGVPVVATDVEGIPEAIRNGWDGVVAKAGDPQELARAIAQIVSGQLDWSALRASALKRHAEKFSDRAMAAGVAGVYREVLAGRHAQPPT